MDLLEPLLDELEAALAAYDLLEVNAERLMKRLDIAGVTSENLEQLRAGDKIRKDQHIEMACHKDAIASAGYLACRHILSHFGDDENTQVIDARLALSDLENLFAGVLVKGGLSLEYVEGHFSAYEDFLADISGDEVLPRFVDLVRRTESDLKKAYYSICDVLKETTIPIPCATSEQIDPQTDYKDMEEVFATDTSFWVQITPDQRKVYADNLVVALKSMQELRILMNAYEKAKGYE